MTGLFDAVASLFAAGGVVMWPLFLVGLVVWFLIGLRWQTLRSTPRLETFDSAEAPQQKQSGLRVLLGHQDALLSQHARLIRSLYRAAPLLGLLGTVSGMIETFASLTGVQGVTTHGSVAGGISQALVTTQMGLVVAIPAVIAGRWLDRRAKRVRERFLAEMSA